jgi:outer membrane protein TolC
MYNKNLIRSLVFGLSIVVSALSSIAVAQDIILPMTLEEALNQAQQTGFENQISSKEVEAAKAQITQSNAAFLPQVFFEETAVSTNDPIGVFGIKLRQGIITNADFNPDLLNNPDAEGNFTTKFQLNQPVFNPDAFMQRSAAKYMFASAQDQQRVTQEYTQLKVKEQYFQLVVIDEQILVVQSFLETVQAIRDQSKNYFDQGIINRADYLNAEVQVLNAEKDLLAVKNYRETINDQLLLLLGITDPQTIQPTDEIELNVGEDFSNVMFSGENSTLSAINNRVMASEAMMKSSRFRFLPKLNVFGSYEFNDASIFGTGADSYMLGASLRWDLFQGMKNIGEVSKTQAEFKKAEIMYQQKLAQMQTETEMVKRSIGEALKSLELSDLVVEQSTEDARIRNDRYEQGLEKTTDLLQSESQLLNHKLERLQVQFNYMMAVAKLEFILETDL